MVKLRALVTCVTGKKDRDCALFFAFAALSHNAPHLFAGSRIVEARAPALDSRLGLRYTLVC